MGDISDKHNPLLILNSERGIAFEEGFKRELARILNLSFEDKPLLYEKIEDKEYQLYTDLGRLVAKVHFERLKTTKVKEISKLAFNEGEYPIGDFRNADFYAIFEEEGREKAVFAELTKEGDLLSMDAEGKSIYNRSEISLSITQAVSFEEYFAFIFEKAKELYGQLPVRAYGELKKILQVLVYSADYLLKSAKSIDLSAVVLYPIKDAFYTEFKGASFKDKELLSEAKEFLKKLRRLPFKTEVKFDTFERTYTPLYPIEEVREEVKRFVRRASKRGNAVVLLHAPASGKTTATLEFVNELSQSGEVFFCYFTTRIAVAQKVADRLKELGFEVLFSEERRYKKSKSRYAKYLFLEKSGNLSLLKSKMVKLGEIPPKLAFSTTFHSLVKTKFGNTVRHLISMIKLFLRRYPEGEIVIGIDEITGADRSFSAYRDLLKALRSESLERKVRLIVFDASLYSGEIFKKEFELKLSIDKGVPAHLTYSACIENTEAVIEGIPHRFAFKPGYPARRLKVIHRELFVEDGKRKNKDVKWWVAEELVSLLTSVSADGGIGLYVQDLELLKICQLLLRKKGIETVAVHSLNKPKVENVKGKVFLFTSALSRGVDLPVEHFFVVVPSFNVETNLAELLQVFYRLRDGKNDGKVERKITVLYPVFEKKAEEFTRLKNRALKRLIGELLEAYIEPKKGKRYPIPIPSVKESRYVSNLLSYAEILRQLENYTSWHRQKMETAITIEGWAKLSRPKIYYPFAVFPKADLKVKIELKHPPLFLLRKLVEKQLSLPMETKLRFLEFLEGFDQNGTLYLNTSSPFIVFLPNLVIPLGEKQLDGIKSITRLGYRIHPFKAWIDSRLMGEMFEVKHNSKIAVFFPQEEIEEFLTLPQVPLVFFGEKEKTG